MTDESLFPPTPCERLARIAHFASEERRHRLHMKERHPAQADYWQGRVEQCDAVLEDVAALAEGEVMP